MTVACAGQQSENDEHVLLPLLSPANEEILPCLRTQATTVDGGVSWGSSRGFYYIVLRIIASVVSILRLLQESTLQTWRPSLPVLSPVPICTSVLPVPSRAAIEATSGA